MWAWPAGLVVAFATGGRPYYVAPLTIVVMLAGVVATEQRAGFVDCAWLVAASALISVPIALPVLPVSAGTANLNDAVAETVGWPELTRQVADVVARAPGPGTGLRRDPDRELRRSRRHRSIRSCVRPPGPSPRTTATPTSADPPTTARPSSRCGTRSAISLPTSTDCRQVATVDNGQGVNNEVQGKPILVCHGLRGDWAEVWKRMRFLS